MPAAEEVKRVKKRHPSQRQKLLVFTLVDLFRREGTVRRQQETGQ